MGSDIHVCAERKSADPCKRNWEEIPGPIEKCWMCRGKKHRVGDKKKPCDHCKGKGVARDHWYNNRNYDTFAILADVRNGVGFAGIRTGDGFNPIAPPRGVPKNSSPAYKKWVKHFGEDGHSHSYFTLAELLAYDWNQTTGHQGVVSPEVYQVWVANGRKGPPLFYCEGVDGPGVGIVSNEEMDQLIAKGVIPALDNVKATEKRLMKGLGPLHTSNGRDYYTIIRWTETYRECASDLLAVVEKLKKFGPPDKVRICFFFDS